MQISMPILIAYLFAIIFAFFIDIIKSMYYIQFKQGYKPERISYPQQTITGGNINMAILKKEQKQKSRNVLLRVSIPAPLLAEIKKTRKICTTNGFYFDIKPDVIGAVEKAVEEAKALVEGDKKE